MSSILFFLLSLNSPNSKLHTSVLAHIPHSLPLSHTPQLRNLTSTHLPPSLPARTVLSLDFRSRSLPARTASNSAQLPHLLNLTLAQPLASVRFRPSDFRTQPHTLSYNFILIHSRSLPNSTLPKSTLPNSALRNPATPNS